MDAVTPQEEYASMAPYGYGSYPRTEATQFNPEDIPEILERIHHNLQIIENKALRDFIAFAGNIDAKTLLSSVTVSAKSEEKTHHPDLEVRIKQKDEISTKIHFGLPKELLFSKEEFHKFKSKNDLKTKDLLEE
jgi:pterin-4a-carbinolamine dehydratase